MIGRRAGLGGRSVASLAVVGLDLDDLDGDLAAVGGRVRGLLAFLAAEDGESERRGLAVDVELAADGDLAVAEQEDLLAAGDDGGDHGARLDDAVALGRLADRRGLEQLLQGADARLLLALLVLGGVVAAVLLEVAFFAGGLDALGDLFAT